MDNESERFVLTPRLTVKLEDALIRHGWTFEDINIISENGMLGKFLDYVQGSAEIITVRDLRDLNKGIIRVNLDTPPILPFDSAVVFANQGGGWVELEKRPDGLYINGKMVSLHLANCQNNGNQATGYEVYSQIKDMPVLHPNISDTLLRFLEFVPADWKYHEKGFSHGTYFWSAIFADQAGESYIRGMYLYYGFWKPIFRPLKKEFSINDLAAVVEI